MKTKKIIFVLFCALLIFLLCACNKVDKIDSIITLDIEGAPRFRDVCILYHEGRYYGYSTGWKMTVSQGDDLRGQFSAPVDCVELPFDDAGDHWAPEVHKYDGKFYMFTTYRSSRTGLHGCGIFVSDHPTGPFKLHSNGTITPDDWDSIDGTLYVDENGEPWMVFVHEHVSTKDGIGTMAAAKLSSDLTHLISEPIEIFKATDAKWASVGVTDGCYMYKTKGGKLLMIWSNFGWEGYAVGIAVSDSGNVLGPWRQIDEPLFSRSMLGKYDGGHGMIFEDKDGRLWMAIHSPNFVEEGNETPILIPLIEKEDMLIWDEYKRF